MLGDDRVGRRVLPTQSVSRVGVWDRLHLVRFALELRQVRPASETRSPLTASVCKQDEIALRTRPAQTIPLLRRRSLMPKVNPSGMTVEALMDLREPLDRTIEELADGEAEEIPYPISFQQRCTREPHRTVS